MTEDQFKQITQWQKETFPFATVLSKLSHLQDEFNELVVDIKGSNPDRRLEFADCFLLLFGAASADGMNYQNICDAIDEKMKINYTRKWGNPDKNGVVNHINDTCVD